MLTLLLPTAGMYAQSVNSENGYSIAPSQPINVLVAYVQYVGCATYPEYPEWPALGMPPYATDPDHPLFDKVMPASGTFTEGTISSYYEEASFGSHMLTADHIVLYKTPQEQATGINDPTNDFFEVTCGSSDTYGGIPAALDNGWTTLTTSNGSHMSDFDNYTFPGTRGELATSTPDGKVDYLVIVWRYCNNSTIVTGGYGPNTPNFDGFARVNLNTQYNGQNRHNLYNIFAGEYMHTLFGGNNWHSAGGADPYTFMSPPRSACTTSQELLGCFCGYDREHLGWENPEKDFLVSAVNHQTSQEVNLESYPDPTITTQWETQTFRLRDFATVGDMIKVKLPHIDWNAVGDVKNQYLVLENHQKISYFDHYGAEGVCGQGSFDSGLYAYIQVGKDLKEPTLGLDIFKGSDNNPNHLGSWMFPLSAEGRHDLISTGMNDGSGFTDECWHEPNTVLTYTQDGAKSNPFNGLQDGYIKKMFDSDNDGFVGSNNQSLDAVTGYIKVIDGIQHWTEPYLGDNNDYFHNGAKISIATNPAPVPVTTWKGDRLNAGVQNYSSYDNRWIHLNGLGIRIVGQELVPNVLNHHGNPVYDLIVEVRWDDYEVDNDVRWCGLISLANDPDDPHTTSLTNPRKNKIELGVSHTISLERGESPTRPIQLADGFFSEPTELHIKSGTELHLGENSTLNVKEGSTLVIYDGAEVNLENGACIVVDETSTLELRGNNINLSGIGSRIVVKGKLVTANDIDVSFSGSGAFVFHENHTLQLGSNSDFSIQRPITAANHVAILLKANTTLILPQHHDLSLTNVGVSFESNSQIKVQGSEIHCVLAHFVGVGANAIGIKAFGMPQCVFNRCSFSNLSMGAYVANQISGYNQPPLFNYCDFNNNTEGLVGYNLDHILIEGCTFNGLFEKAIRLENVELASVTLTEINPQNEDILLGVDLKQVDIAYFTQSNITDANTGIQAERSNVYLRKGTYVQNCQLGVSFVNNPNSNYLLNVGQCGCAYVINNVVGIAGENFRLQIDQIENAYECNQTTIHPNRFDGNGVIFDICYTDPDFAPYIIPMQVNYWGGQSIDAYSYYIRWDGCETSSDAVLVNASQYVEDIAEVVDCGLIELSHPPIPDSTFTQIDQTACIIYYEGVNRLVHKQSKNGSIELVDENIESAEDKYVPVSDLTVLPGYTQSCRHKVYVARCIVEAAERDVWTRSDADWDAETTASVARTESEQCRQLQKIIAGYSIESDITHAKLMDISGKTLFTCQVSEVTKHVELLPDGVFVVVAYDTNDNKRCNHKLVVVH